MKIKLAKYTPGPGKTGAFNARLFYLLAGRKELFKNCGYKSLMDSYTGCKFKCGTILKASGFNE
ncbi:MAG: hypothetical protein FJW68_01395 [Actinobacteria bacterium]|nr:hypothetical protein [Actinomycetota bacterium]